MQIGNGRNPKRFTMQLAGSLVAIALLIYLVRKESWSEIFIAIRQIPPWRFVLAFLLITISRLATVGRWHVLLHGAGVQIPLKETMRITYAGLFASNFLPTTVGGDVVRLAGILRLDYDRAICAASLIVDRLAGMAGMSMTLPVGVQRLASRLAIGASSPLAGAILPAALVKIVPAKWLEAVYSKSNRIARRLLQALSIWLGQPRSLLQAILFTWLHMFCLFSLSRVLLNGMGQSISFWLLGGLWSVSYFVTLLPISVNGLGVQELSMTVLFSVFGGLTEHNALTLAILYRALMMFASLPGALFIPGILASFERQPALATSPPPEA